MLESVLHRRSTVIQEQLTSGLSERVLEVAGQQLQKTRISEHKDNQSKQEFLSIFLITVANKCNSYKKQEQQKKDHLKNEVEPT